MATENKNLSQYNKEQLPNASKYRFGIVVSKWNPEITNALYEGAKTALLDLGTDKSNILTYEVPGSYELIYGCKKMQQQAVDAVIAIGSIIQGETKHFDFVCQAVSQGIKDLNILHNVPVIFCVLTDDTLKQAQDRSGGKHGNKGVEAAVAAVEMAFLNGLS